MASEIRRLALAILLAAAAAPPSTAAANHKFEVTGSEFRLDDKKLVMISGEMHYPRVPRVYWRDRMRKMRAMGLNTLTTYVFWNAHESQRGKFDFSGELDVAEFVRTAQQEGLWVILRPGPYVCAEWDMGGLPAWLLQDPAIRVRQNEPKFLAAAAAYMKEVGRRLAPLQVNHGGPILMVQVENEYGSFGSDHAYMNAIRKMIVDSGFDGQLYTADGADRNRLEGGTFPDLPIAINFGNNENPDAEFAKLAAFRAKGPLMCGEFWAGWFDTWGEPHQTTPVARASAALDWMLSRGISVSLYMFHGGTNFGFNAGADFRTAYMPDTTSYDYDSPLDEAGRPNAKFTALRDVIRRHLPKDTVLPDVPAPLPMIDIPRFNFTESVPVKEAFGNSVQAPVPINMEALHQAHGPVLYRADIKTAFKGTLEIDGIRDYAIVYSNATRIGSLDRRLNQKSIQVDLPASSTLHILMDVMGHVNFGPRMIADRKGFAAARLGTAAIGDWHTVPIGIDPPPGSGFTTARLDGPGFHRATVRLDQLGDTYLDMRGWGKGYVWVNGHNLGRFWNIGPQQALFLPSGWLRLGDNEFVVFDLEPTGHRSIAGVRNPIWETRSAAK